MNREEYEHVLAFYQMFGAAEAAHYHSPPETFFSPGKSIEHTSFSPADTSVYYACTFLDQIYEEIGEH